MSAICRRWACWTVLSLVLAFVASATARAHFILVVTPPPGGEDPAISESGDALVEQLEQENPGIPIIRAYVGEGDDPQIVIADAIQEARDGGLIPEGQVAVQVHTLGHGGTGYVIIGHYVYAFEGTDVTVGDKVPRTLENLADFIDTFLEAPEEGEEGAHIFLWHCFTADPGTEADELRGEAIEAINEQIDALRERIEEIEEDIAELDPDDPLRQDREEQIQSMQQAIARLEAQIQLLQASMGEQGIADVAREEIELYERAIEETEEEIEQERERVEEGLVDPDAFEQWLQEVALPYIQTLVDEIALREHWLVSVAERIAQLKSHVDARATGVHGWCLFRTGQVPSGGGGTETFPEEESEDDGGSDDGNGDGDDD